MLVCRLLYLETVSFFYEHNTIIVPEPIFADLDYAIPSTSDVLLIRSMHFTSEVLDRYSTLLPYVLRLFPALQRISIDLYSKHSLQPPFTTSSGAAVLLSRNPRISNLDFRQVGHFIATTLNGTQLIAALIREWQTVETEADTALEVTWARLGSAPGWALT
jgi:hypothetical protein